MPLLRRRAKTELLEHYTALDIGTDNVKALIVRREKENGVVVGASRHRQTLASMNSGAVSDIAGVVDACSLALEAAEDMAGAIPGQVVIGIAGELVRGFATSATFPRTDPEARMTEGEMQQLLELVQRRAMRQAGASLSQETGAPVEVKLVHSAITTVRIDGHHVVNPVGFQGKTLDVTVFNTFAPLTHVGALEAVAAELDLELLALVAEPYAVARCCASEEVREHGGIFVDIGGGTTDVALVRNGGIEATRMFALGGRVFTKRVSNELGMRLGQAEETKVRYSEGRLEAEAAQALRRPMLRDAEVLVEGVALVLEELAREDRLPSTLYMCGGGSALPEVQEVMEAYPWVDRLPFTRPPAIRRLRPSDVAGIYDATGRLLSEQDVTPMGLAFHGLGREDEGEALMNHLMRRILKAMKV